MTVGSVARHLRSESGQLAAKDLQWLCRKHCRDCQRIPVILISRFVGHSVLVGCVEEETSALICGHRPSGSAELERMAA